VVVWGRKGTNGKQVRAAVAEVLRLHSQHFGYMVGEAYNRR